MSDSQSFSLYELCLAEDRYAENQTVDQHQLSQLLTSAHEGRAEQQIAAAKDSTTHFGKLLEEYILKKHSELINTIFKNEIISSFSVIEHELFESEFLIVKSNGELHVRSFVSFSKSEQLAPRLHVERLGLRLFAIIDKHIKAHNIPENEPFDFIDKQFIFKYDGPNKERIYIQEFTPRVVEVDPTIEENEPQSKPKSKPSINKSFKIPPNILEKLRTIHRKYDEDFNEGDAKSNEQLWNRIQDIAYGPNVYDPEELKELKEIIKSWTSWQYENTKDKEKQVKWDDMIDALNNPQSYCNHQ